MDANQLESSGSTHAQQAHQQQSSHSPLDRSTIHASVPLRELVGYASSLRAVSAGEAGFTMQLEGYSEVDAATTKKILKDGF